MQAYRKPSDAEVKRINHLTEVMRAFADGKQIQSRTPGRSNEQWADVTTPAWNFNAIEYRIKPAILEAIVVFSAAGLPVNTWPNDEANELYAFAHAAHINGTVVRFVNGLQVTANVR